MLKRLWKYLTRPAATPEIAALYQTCIAQARQPFFYDALEVPDTLDGRFDMLLLHVFLVVEALRDAPVKAQELFDLMFADMDKNLREIGVSDISIAKKIKPMFEAFYGRAQAYRAALAAPDDAALSAALGRNIYAGNAAIGRPVDAEKLHRLTLYVRRAARNLASQPRATLLTGRVDFPAPDAP